MEESGSAKITSYINNLHPQLHKGLYSVIEQIIDRVVPMWERSLSMSKATYAAKRRIDDFKYEYEFETLKGDPIDDSKKNGGNKEDDNNEEVIESDENTEWFRPSYNY